MGELPTAFSTRSAHASFGGVQGYYRHDSSVIGLPMQFAVYRPPQAGNGPLPCLFYLAGLTCTEETFAIKAGAQRVAAQLGLILVMPDTSPRQTGIEGESADWEIGSGAGFYLDAARAPWSRFFRMQSYVVNELQQLVVSHFGVNPQRIGIFGHSMGGHGALTLALKHPQTFKSVSAFAPIAAPTKCPWGIKAFTTYLGPDHDMWTAHDASCLMRGAASPFPKGILIDQGLGDQFLAQQLHLDEFESACQVARQALTLRRHASYDHGYFFISSFVEDHLRFHAQRL